MVWCGVLVLVGPGADAVVSPCRGRRILLAMPQLRYKEDHKICVEAQPLMWRMFWHSEVVASGARTTRTGLPPGSRAVSFDGAALVLLSVGTRHAELSGIQYPVNPVEHLQLRARRDSHVIRQLDHRRQEPVVKKHRRL